MSNIVKPFRGTQINWSHPLSRGLVGCWLMNEYSGKSLFDAASINADRPSTDGAGISWKKGGLEWIASGTKDYFSVKYRSGLDSESFTILAIVTPYSTGWLPIFSFGVYSNHYDMYSHAGNISLIINGNYSGHEKPVPGGFTNQRRCVAVGFDGVSTRYYYADGEFLGTTTATNIPTADSTKYGRIGSSVRWGSERFSGIIELIYVWNRLLQKEEIKYISINPYQIFETKSIPAILGISTGGTTYTEDLLSTISSISSVQDAQSFIERLQSVIASQSTVSDAQTFLETLLSQAQSQAVAEDLQNYIENLISTAQAVSSVSDGLSGLSEQLLSTAVTITSATDQQTYRETIDTVVSSNVSAEEKQHYLESLATLISSGASVSDAAAMIENLLSTAVSTASVTDLLGTVYSESLLTTVASVSAVNEAQTYVDTVNSLITSGVSAEDLQGFSEKFTTTIHALDTVEDRQLYIENIGIMAKSQVSLGEIMQYIDQVFTAATSLASVQDVLVGAFVGKYIFGTVVPKREFLSVVPQREFVTEVSAR